MSIKEALTLGLYHLSFNHYNHHNKIYWLKKIKQAELFHVRQVKELGLNDLVDITGT